MPHIHVRISPGIASMIDSDRLLSSLVQVLSQIESIRSDAVKAYLSVHEEYTVGEGHPQEFAHCSVSILDGRPEQLKQEIADRMYERFRQHLLETNAQVGITLEVREMPRELYRK